MSKNDDSLSSLSLKYQKKTDKEHILSNPDTYIGSIECVDGLCWLYDKDSNKMVQKCIEYVPGLYKLFDEGIVNCRDHYIRMKSLIDSEILNVCEDNVKDKDKNVKDYLVSSIEVSIDDDGVITMFNDGNGIDVAMHPEYNVWIPELIFSHLRSSTNYNKDEKRIVGGKNGFGFKLVLIWSSFGSVETYDHKRGLKYYQEYHDNLERIDPAVITKLKGGKPYTRIKFRPDYERLCLKGLNNSMRMLMEKRVYDISAVTDKNVKVKLNNELIKVKTFQNYVDLYIGNKTDKDRAYEMSNDRWEYAVCLSELNEFVHVSFVNGIYVSKGGKHVEYILNQIIRKLNEYIEKKKKIKVNGNIIKDQLMLFIRCDIDNPSFDSQTKDYMNTPCNKFGSKCEVSDKFIEKIIKMDILDTIYAINELKENKNSKKSDGVKSKSIKGIPKLVDANYAGTDKSHLCSLILCEGDSAKTGVISGLSSSDRNIIGVYPLKGKLMNVRGELSKKVSDNKEINEIKKILGLVCDMDYKDMDDINKKLRYSKVIVMTDQDLDGSHIKGLCINLFHNMWKSLIEVEGFFSFMNTPILKAKKGNKVLKFYNKGEYDRWKEQNSINGWSIKYYKGLGTSTKLEFMEYFKEKKIVDLVYKIENSDNYIDLVFNKKRSDDRKTWLQNNYDRNIYLDTSKNSVPYEDFINKELIHFSKYDCDRSIPNMMDGLKISLRKILYCAFKKNLNNEIKVAQFSGYVSENACYHHGEDSLNKAIIGMAQNFVGSNNINLLKPIGQYGSRIQGGSDSSSPRYIFTKLEKITRFIYRVEDDEILNYLDDDGILVEPLYYVPIIPMIIVNGSKGIGTGFSTDIMCYNPNDVIDYIIKKLKKEDYDNFDFYPYYEGFKGDIVKINKNKYLFLGKYERKAKDIIRVTELPVGFWNDDFKMHLESLCSDKNKEGEKIKPIIKSYEDHSKDINVDFTIYFQKDKFDEFINQMYSIDNYNIDGLIKLLKLYNVNSLTNMNIFNDRDKLVKYDSISKIIDDYYVVRLNYYDIRKKFQIVKLEKELIFYKNKVRYIEEILNDKLDLRKKSRDEIIHVLTERGYDRIDEDNEYKYLLKLPMDSVSIENIENQRKEYEKKNNTLMYIKNVSISSMWLKELEELKEEYFKYKKERAKEL